MKFIHYKKIQPYLICGLAALFYLYDYFIQVAPSIMTEQLMHDFKIGAGDLGVLSGCFYYSYTLMQIPAGMMLDQLGARKLLCFSVLISAMGVLIFASAHYFILLCLSRFFIGLGSSFAFISALFLVAQWFSHRYFALIAGFIQLGGSLGSIIGLAPLAFLINKSGWRDAMWSIGIFTCLLAVVFVVVIKDGHVTQKREKITYRGLAIKIKTLVNLKQVWWISICGLISWVPVATIGALWGVPYVMKVYGMSNVESSYICTAFWFGLGLGSPFMGWLSSHRYGSSKPFVACFVFSLVGAILVLLAPYLPIAATVIALFIYGLSSSAQSLSFLILKENVPQHLFATASGVNNMAAILGGAIFQPFVGWVLHVLWLGNEIDNVPIYTVHEYTMAFLALPIMAMLGIFISYKKIFRVSKVNF